jgi:hypothetical protein
VLSVVKALSLTNDPEFVEGPGTESLRSRIRGLVRTAAHAMGLQEEARHEVSSQGALEQAVLDGVLRNLSITREDVPSVRGGIYRSVVALRTDIVSYIEGHNVNPKPFRWTKSADDILRSIERFCACNQPASP